MATSASALWTCSLASHFSDSSRTHTAVIFTFCSTHAAAEQMVQLDLLNWLDLLVLLILLLRVVSLDRLELRDTWLVESHWVTESCRLSSSGWLVPLSGEFSRPRVHQDSPLSQCALTLNYVTGWPHRTRHRQI